jgi:hypothetical protein
MFQFYNFDCPDITTNMEKNDLSIREVEDRKVTIPSYDLFHTIPFTFDKVYWEAYWLVVDEPILALREVMMKLETE